MKTLARNLRKNQTDAEKIIWYQLRNRNLCGYKFRRQHPIGNYIVDFVCIDKKLIIELDGGQHQLQKEADLERTKTLNQMGFKVLRFWNNSVLENPDAVLGQVLGLLQA